MKHIKHVLILFGEINSHLYSHHFALILPHIYRLDSFQNLKSINQQQQRCQLCLDLNTAKHFQTLIIKINIELHSRKLILDRHIYVTGSSEADKRVSDEIFTRK